MQKSIITKYCAGAIAVAAILIAAPKAEASLVGTVTVEAIIGKNGPDLAVKSDFAFVLRLNRRQAGTRGQKQPGETIKCHWSDYCLSSHARGNLSH